MSAQIQNRSDALNEFYNAPDEALFNQMTVAAIRECSKFTMERDRWNGGGIPFVKIGRAVRYRKADVVEWLGKCQTVNSTSEAV
ncbi:MAG: helix-turn-helix domain-containing protein [Methylococcaceae bacterium]